MRTPSRRETLIGAAIAIAIIALLAFGTNIVLYLNFLLGNDIIVRLSVDQSALTLARFDTTTVTFTATVTTNPFCTGVCSSRFEDISDDAVIATEDFPLKPGRPFTVSYPLSGDKPGSGQDLYRFTMECKSVPSLGCYSDSSPTRRSLLVSVDYHPSQAETLLKNEYTPLLLEYADRLADALAWHDQLEARFALASVVSFDELLDTRAAINQSLRSIDTDAQSLSSLWAQENYFAINDLYYPAAKRMTQLERDLSALNQSVTRGIESYERALISLNATAGELIALSSLPLSSEADAREITAAIEAYHRFISVPTRSGSSWESASALANGTASLSASIRAHVSDAAILAGIQADIEREALCLLGNCSAHPPLAQRLNQTDYRAACLELRSIAAWESSLASGNASGSALALRASVGAGYLANLTHSPRAVLSLARQNQSPPALNESGLIAGLAASVPTCVLLNTSFPSIRAPPRATIASPPPPANRSILAFPAPVPTCCVFGVCQACCSEAGCADDPSTFPVMFVHGHAFSKDIAAELSLDAFNGIQSQLDHEGYLYAGVISEYTRRDARRGIWGEAKVPMTIKASYYLDVFKQPDNYVVVQTKSENIDTYAVRLADIIDTVLYTTGKSKTTIVAHSMGGLVARRYVQIFGSAKVDRLILIGTPNFGIEKDIQQYCALFGETLECKDMDHDSLFLNKLATGPQADIPVYNIIGSGCAMKGGDGDGVVLVSRATLPGAHNIIINGTCDTFSPLHLRLLSTSRHPETYEAIKSALDSRNSS